MAYNITRKDPQESNKRQALGVVMPFTSDTVFVPTYNTLDAYKVNLYNFFTTGRGERYLNPELGSNLLTLIFNQEGVGVNMEQMIQDELQTFFPKLEVTNIAVREYPEEHFCQIQIWFKVRGTMLEDSITLDVEQ